MKEKSGKKLAGLTALMAVITLCIVFAAALIINERSRIRLLDQYIHELPKIVEGREAELRTRSRVFEEDIQARGELGTLIFREKGRLSAEERLEKVCGAVSAKSVSLTDEKGAVISTTGIEMPTEIFEERAGSLEPDTPAFEIYTIPSEEGEKKDGRALIMLPLEEEGRSLVFEFSFEPLLELQNALTDWSYILGRMLSGLDASAFVRIGEDDPIGYPYEEMAKDGQLMEDERELLKNEAREAFQREGGFFSFGEDSSIGIISLGSRPALGVRMPYPDKDAEVLIAMPLWDLIRTGVYGAITLAAFIVLNLILFVFYVKRVIGRRPDERRREAFRAAPGRMTRTGRWIMIAAIACFSVMLLLLENRASVAYVGMTKRAALQSEVAWHDAQSGMIRGSYTDIYRNRAKSLADLLEEHKEYRTRDDLLSLSNVLRAEYVMLFDENGEEIISSNSYTGFSAAGPDANLSEDYRAVLLGYPSAVVGPEKDPYTGEARVGAAILMTKESGEPEGFLLAVFDADAMNAELDGASLENAVNAFAVAEGNEAAVIRNEDGVFLAHTDPFKIGLSAEDCLAENTYGDDYEGFTKYNGLNMYVSGVSDGEKSLLFMQPDRLDLKAGLAAAALIALLLAVIFFLYCPKACALCMDAMNEDDDAADMTAAEKERAERVGRAPSAVFANGYSVFFTALALIAWLAASLMEWPAFAFVFGGMWTRGVHLFSIWAALFFLAVVLSVTLIIRTMLRGAERRADLRSRTVLRLLDSFAAYAAGILLIAGILYMFGVNTVALIASAGIVSIAIGMGSKDMVADILAGLFLAIEDSVHIGDVVSVGSWQGRVTDMGVRTTEITDENRNVKILNNSHISDVVNMSRCKTSCSMELELERSADMAETEKILRDALEAASEEMPELLGSLKLAGVSNISDTGFTARLTYECAEAVRESVTKRLRAFIEHRVRSDMQTAFDTKDA